MQVHAKVLLHQYERHTNILLRTNFLKFITQHDAMLLTKICLMPISILIYDERIILLLWVLLIFSLSQPCENLICMVVFTFVVKITEMQQPVGAWLQVCYRNSMNRFGNVFVLSETNIIYCLAHVFGFMVTRNFWFWFRDVCNIYKKICVWCFTYDSNERHIKWELVWELMLSVLRHQFENILK